MILDKMTKKLGFLNEGKKNACYSNSHKIEKKLNIVATSCMNDKKLVVVRGVLAT